MNRFYFFTTIALLAVNACGTPGRPIGLPAPEYEEPRVEPWTPPSDSAPPAEAPAAEAPPAPPSASPPVPENVAGSGATLPAGTQ